MPLKTLKVANSCRLNENPLQSLCEGLELFPRTNALEILDITITVYAVDRLVSVRDGWGRWDIVTQHPAYRTGAHTSPSGPNLANILQRRPVR